VKQPNQQPGVVTFSSSNVVEGETMWACIEVRDTGIGIEPQSIPKLFSAFEQGGEAVTRAFGGLGLGLNISKALAVMHRGDLSVRSEGANRGATFTF